MKSQISNLKFQIAASAACALLGAFALAALAQPFTFRDPGFVGGLNRAPASSLVSSNDLQSYLKLDNTLADSFGDDFTDNNGISFDTGVIGQAVIITKADDSDPCNPVPPKYVTHGTDARFNISNNWTIAAWVRVADNTVDNYICSKTADAAAAYFFQFSAENGAYQIYSYSTLGGLQWATASTFGVPDNDQWNFVAARMTAGILLEISVNGGAWDSTVTLGGTTASADTLTLGASVSLDVSSDMMIDEFQIWKRALSNADVKKLAGVDPVASPPPRPQLP